LWVLVELLLLLLLPLLPLLVMLLLLPLLLAHFNHRIRIRFRALCHLRRQKLLITTATATARLPGDPLGLLLA
jgi:hypothetical protein